MPSALKRKRRRRPGRGAAAPWRVRSCRSRCSTSCSRSVSCSLPTSSARPGSPSRTCSGPGWAARTWASSSTTSGGPAPPSWSTPLCRWVSDSWRALLLLLSLCLQLVSWMLVMYWSRCHWSNHPISRALQAHAPPPPSSWGAVASSINTEFRRIDKFATGAPGARVIVTDSWVLKVSTYHVHVASQTDCHVTVTESRRHQLSPDSPSPTEILTLRVDSINPGVRPFTIRLNSTEYSDLREKLRCPIRTSSNVSIHRTVSELFLDTFRTQVELNPSYSLPRGQEAELCIGCMQVAADTKLVHLCSTPGTDGDLECQPCFCRPMWCMSCLGRWFSSRQDQQRPETWLSSRAPCPTCRATFCILDICVVR
ncbi:E3 ubiquitin-protein ligase TM129 isoform X4 [Brachyistius frenatus]|uniref:E3 ubiquitin-protein ligase TM129 isoform X4 n=1 Tax=Brachyistius frenatus TaxID=100188 RepID=UPI0037E8436B